MIDTQKTVRQNKIWKHTTRIIAAAWLIFAITFNLRLVLTHLDELGDFGSFLASGISLKEGTNPYGTSSPLIFIAEFPRVQAGGKLPNLNPPITLFAFKAISGFDYLQAANIWRILSFLIFVVAVLVLANHYKPSVLRMIWMFSLAGFWHTIGLGQIYTPLLLLATLAWVAFIKQKNVLAGLCLGFLISIKPNFLLWLFFLVVIKNWEAILASLATIFIIGIIPLLALQPKIYLQWLTATGVDNSILAMPGNSSLMGLFSRLDNTEIGLFLSLGLLGFLLILLYKKRDGLRKNPEVTNEFGILFSLLASPIAWAGYTILTIPVFLQRRRWVFPILLAAAILTLPFNFTMHYYYIGSFHFVFWGWWYGIALTIVFIDGIVRLWRLPARPELRG